MIQIVIFAKITDMTTYAHKEKKESIKQKQTPNPRSRGERKGSKQQIPLDNTERESAKEIALSPTRPKGKDFSLDREEVGWGSDQRGREAWPGAKGRTDSSQQA